jgi:hypothetical protein
MIPVTPPNTPISANTLFHFTDNMDNLLSILERTFRPHYCLEDYTVFGNAREDSLEIAVPLISFCDIPLFSVRTHIRTYGHYGIGMTKQWGMRYHMSPVIYTYRQSHLRQYLARTLEFASNRNPDPSDDLSDKVERTLDMVSSHVKPYEGRMWRRGSYIEPVRFYDEREWRFVPSAQSHALPASLTKAEFFNEQYRDSVNRRLMQGFRLEFQPDDIRYIILDHETDILPMIRAIEDIKGLYPPDTVKLLTTRIITVDQILSDF